MIKNDKRASRLFFFIMTLLTRMVPVTNKNRDRQKRKGRKK